MKNVLSVSEVNRYIKDIISKDFVLSNIWIRGEISNFKLHSSGHMYFTLKDEGSTIKCVMFRMQGSSLKFRPESGLKVIIRGYVSVFERDGQYQLYADEMQPDGIGSLHLAFEQLKTKLSEQGYFDAKYKKKIPFLPSRIGVVTSPTGAVIRDILNVLSRRFGNFELKLFPVAVQGATAPEQISRALNLINSTKLVDVIIIARGGGSLEELWAFNEEIVARSIFQSEIPIISAVGHETDFTIADFVADLRAPTPSAAAEIVMPEKALLKNKLSNIEHRLINALKSNLNLKRAKFERLKNSVVFRQPFERIYQSRMKLDLLDKYMLRALIDKNEKAKGSFNYLLAKLNALSPLTVLSRGYGILNNKDNQKLIHSINEVSKGDIVDIALKDGSLECVVNKVEERSW